jgi:hypothetical protein
MSTKIPTLSTIGWVDTIEKKGDRALSYFFTSEYSQSTLYPGKIASLQYLVKENGSNVTNLQTQVRDVLDNLLRRYFEQVDVTVRVSNLNPEEPGKLIIRFRCIIRENGVEYSLGRQVELLNGTLDKIRKINNG